MAALQKSKTCVSVNNTVVGPLETWSALCTPDPDLVNDDARRVHSRRVRLQRELCVRLGLGQRDRRHTLILGF